MTSMVDYRELVHTPAELSEGFVKWAEGLKNVPGVPFGIPVVDEHVIPFHPGDMIVLCARPGHAKTSMLCYLARAEAKRILERKTQEGECVVYVTFEQVAEEINVILQASNEFTANDLVRGQVNLDDVKRAAIKRISLPIWIVGDSLMRTNARSPRMYPEAVFLAIESMKEDFGMRPTLICLDYIQLIPIPQQADRQKQVIEAAHGCKELAKRVGAPVVVAVQARREVDQRDNKIPGMWDAQWSSSIEQTADKFFSLWRPWLTEPHTNEFGQPNSVTIDEHQHPVTKELLVMQMHKQRFDNGSWIWPLHFNPAYLKVCSVETDVEAVPWNE